MKISVIIVTHNRRDDLKRSIEGFLAQDYPDKEIVIVDNASIDGTREMVTAEYPQLKYIWLPDNFDIRSLNLTIEMSDGDILWRTDDDSYPEEIDAFSRVVAIFHENPDIHVIAMEDIEVRQGYKAWQWYPYEVDKVNIPPKGYPANLFPGTGAAIRREVTDKIGGFWEFGFEELDFCTRAIINGFNIRYFPDIRVLHYAAPAGRMPATRWVKASKQYVRYHWRYFPFWYALGRTFLIFFFQLFIAVLYRLPISAFFEGAFGMLSVMFSAYREERNPVPKNKLKEITLGVSLFKTQMNFFRTKIRSIINKSKLKKTAAA